MTVVINGTTGLTLPNGSAAAPAESGTTSTNTGVSFPSANTVVVSTNGVAAMTVGATQNITTPNAINMSSSFLRNRIINGDMRIDQRNSGASGTAVNTYTVDRWGYGASQTSKGTWGQNLNSITGPTGFSNYLGFQSSSSYTVASGDSFSLYQPIEGYNFADFGFGTASAQSLTVSFWVYSSLTGTFGGTLKNYAQTRSCPFSYTISSANTWTYITVTIPGDTGGTWVGNSSAGAAFFQFGLGVGTTYSGTAGSWAGSNYVSATGAVSVVGTSGATFYVTGVQLEAGTVATPFERKIYSQQLIDCQRYYWINSSATNSVSYYMTVFAYSTTLAFGVIQFPVTMRTTPTISTTGTPANYRIYLGGNQYALTGGPDIDQDTPYSSDIRFTTAGTLTVGQAGMAGANASTAAFLGFNAEL